MVAESKSTAETAVMATAYNTVIHLHHHRGRVGCMAVYGGKIH
jgi:hypothetical protein